MKYYPKEPVPSGHKDIKNPPPAADASPRYIGTEWFTNANAKNVERPISLHSLLFNITSKP